MPVHDWTRVDAGIFHDFHLEWNASIKHALNRGILPEGYYALAEQVAGGLHPDVLTLERVSPADAPADSNGASPGAETGGIALATEEPRARFTEVANEGFTRKTSRVAIRHVSGDDVVAVVEIVSPGNKASQHGLRSFLQKTTEFLLGGVHLLVLDLHPPTPRDPQGIHIAVWSEIAQPKFQFQETRPLTLAAYAAGDLPRAYINPVAAADTLPDMPIFLTPQSYVYVPLEATYQAAFAEVPRRWQGVLEGA